MRRSLGFALAVVLGLALSSGLAWARPVDLYKLYLLTFGEPIAVGVLTSAGGANVTNASTGVPFSLPAAGFTTGQVISVQCDATVYFGFGSTCGTTLATSAGCFRVTATDGPKVVIVQDTTTGATAKINAAGPAAFNCIVAKLQ